MSQPSKLRTAASLLGATLAALLLGACATQQNCVTPVGDRGLTPSASMAAQRNGAVVTWGGRILGVRNLERTTEIEAVGYPLDSCGRPVAGKSGQGRFLIRYPGYLEPTDYAPGRQMTATGRIRGVSRTTIGAASYSMPVLEEATVRLWPGQAQAADSRARSPRIRPSIGIGIGSGGPRIGAGIGVFF